jgi:hypothetical protein
MCVRKCAVGEEGLRKRKREIDFKLLARGIVRAGECVCRQTGDAERAVATAGVCTWSDMVWYRISSSLGDLVFFSKAFN